MRELPTPGAQGHAASESLSCAGRNCAQCALAQVGDGKAKTEIRPRLRSRATRGKNAVDELPSQPTKYIYGKTYGADVRSDFPPSPGALGKLNCVNHAIFFRHGEKFFNIDGLGEHFAYLAAGRALFACGSNEHNRSGGKLTVSIDFQGA